MLVLQHSCTSYPLDPFDVISPNPEMAPAARCINRWPYRDSPVFVLLDRPMRPLARHQIKSNGLPTSTRTSKPQPFWLLRRTNEDELFSPKCLLEVSIRVASHDTGKVVSPSNFAPPIPKPLESSEQHVHGRYSLSGRNKDSSSLSLQLTSLLFASLRSALLE